MRQLASRTFTALLLLATAEAPAMADRRSSVYSCGAFARMGGMNLPRELPCIYGMGSAGELYFKQHKLYCYAMALQEDIRNLQGCSLETFDLHKKIYRKE
tara:strand:- start:36 stop:335 length:300 start_codon:yes stop_codon:yes gene_type:complete